MESMDIGKLNENEKLRFKTLVKLLKDEFGVLPEDVQEALDEVQEVCKTYTGFKGNFFIEYIMTSANSYEMCMELCTLMKKGLAFDRAVAQCIARW